MLTTCDSSGTLSPPPRWSVIRPPLPAVLATIGNLIGGSPETWLVWPMGEVSDAPPPEVPDEIARDYKESCLVLGISPNASAALSRRCLQNILRSNLKLETSNTTLFSEICKFRKKHPYMPTDLSEGLDLLRKLSNVASHPELDKNTGDCSG